MAIRSLLHQHTGVIAGMLAIVSWLDSPHQFNLTRLPLPGEK